MVAALDIITDALLEIGVLADGETMSSSMSDNALRQLNRMVDMFSNDGAFAYYPSVITKVMVAGVSSFTVGPSGDVITDRPISVSYASVDYQGITYPARVIDYTEWKDIVYKSATTMVPSLVFYEATIPDGVVHLWPIPSGGSINLQVTNQVVSFPDLSTDIDIPPGYEEMLVKNLAARISPQYPGCVLSALTVAMAQKSLSNIRKTNNSIPLLKVDRALPGRGSSGLADFMGGN